MSRTYRLTAPAEADIENIYQYTAETWGLEQAAHYLTSLHDRLAEVSASPLLGKDRSDLRRGVRSRPAERHVVYYAIMDGAVTILRVMHPSQFVSRQRLTGRRK